MRIWQVKQPGDGPYLAQGPVPQPEAGQALVRVEAVGLNFADLLMRDGKYQVKPALPYVPGMELAGTVESLGPGADGPAVGSRVLAYLGQGALAEWVCVAADRLLPLPDAMPFDHAAAFPIAYGTSHLALDHKARLQPKERLLVLGAAGGVGLTAVEIGARMGAEVIACARGAEKLAVARAAGATILIDSDTPDLKAAFKALGGVDVVYDTIGGEMGEAALSSLRPEGRFLAIGFAGGTPPQIKANHLLVKNITVIGLWWGGYVNFAPAVLDASLRQLLAWYAAGGLRPHVSHSLPFEQVPQALDLLAARKSTGKVVITRS
jgi:NADPH2:quinone reductase